MLLEFGETRGADSFANHISQDTDGSYL